MKLKERDERLYFMDWLRVIVVILIIPYHVAVTFSHIGNGYIYTDEPVKSVSFFLRNSMNELRRDEKMLYKITDQMKKSPQDCLDL